MTAPIDPTQPVAPKPLQTPYPPNEILLPFQPPVTVQNGVFASGKTLLELLESGEYQTQMAAASVAANIAQHPPDNVTVLVGDNTYNIIGEITDYIKLTFQEARNRVGTGQLLIKDIDPMGDVILSCAETVVPIIIETGGERWTGRVVKATYQMTHLQDQERPMKTILAELANDWIWLSKTLVWPDFLEPIEVQFPAEALYFGPAVTCIATMISEQRFRLQSGIFELINNMGSLDLNWQAWFGTLLESDGDLETMLLTPMVVVPIDPLTDNSPWISISGRMDQCETLIEKVCFSTGTNVVVKMWLPGDPQPVGLAATLTVATAVVTVTNDLGVTGPSGTFLDGILQDIVDLNFSLVGNALAPLLNPAGEYAPQGINIAPTLGVNFVQPWVLFTDSKKGGAIEFSVQARHPLATTVVGGGKSPQWLNNFLNIAVGWAIEAITTIVGISGIPTSLFDGVIDDVLFAFQQLENGPRRVQLGPYAFDEYFVQTGSSAYTPDEWFALEGAMWDTGPLYTYQWTFLNGYPYTFGVDLFVGQLASFAVRGKLYTDWVDSIVYTDDRTTRLGRVELTVGDKRLVENPVAKLYRKLVGFEKAFQIITLSYN